MLRKARQLLRAAIAQSFSTTKALSMWCSDDHDLRLRVVDFSSLDHPIGVVANDLIERCDALGKTALLAQKLFDSEWKNDAVDEARAFAAAHPRCFEYEPKPSEPPSEPAFESRPTPPSPRRPWAIAIVAIVAIVAITGGSIAWYRVKHRAAWSCTTTELAQHRGSAALRDACFPCPSAGPRPQWADARMYRLELRRHVPRPPHEIIAECSRTRAVVFQFNGASGTATDECTWDQSRGGSSARVALDANCMVDSTLRANVIVCSTSEGGATLPQLRLSEGEGREATNVSCEGR
ncbi:MAG: hypothetical protein JNK05_30555 [Myxococcales bacterium]|nr:hypothetical protein [Myxococcales bacterium]